MAFAHWQLASSFGFLRRPAVHDYTTSENGVDYVLEAIAPAATKFYMTAQRKGIKPGHIIILKQEEDAVHYRVEKLDYYATPADMWIAVLTRIV
jgi:hypothetical protein